MLACHSPPSRMSNTRYLPALGNDCKRMQTQHTSKMRSIPIGEPRNFRTVQLCSASSKDAGTHALDSQGIGRACLAALPLLLKTSAASADEFGLPGTRGITIGEVVLLSAPILLYGLFTLYREKVNPKATISDFLFITAGVVIVGNIFSILVLKVRIF